VENVKYKAIKVRFYNHQQLQNPYLLIDIKEIFSRNLKFGPSFFTEIKKKKEQS